MLMTPRPHEHKPSKRLDKWRSEPWPEGNTFTIQAAALLVGKTKRTIYNVLYENAAHLSPRKVCQLYRHKGDFRHYRILTEADMAFIRTRFRVLVK